MTNEILDALDQWLPILLWGGLFLVFLRLARPLSAIVCTLAFLGLFISPWAWTQTFAFVLLPLTMWLEAIAGDKIYARFLGGKSGTKPGDAD